MDTLRVARDRSPSRRLRDRGAEDRRRVPRRMPFDSKRSMSAGAAKACGFPRRLHSVSATRITPAIPRRASIMLYPGGVSETEILLAYGGVRFASKVGQLAGNHFITLTSNLEKLPNSAGSACGTARRTSGSKWPREKIMSDYAAPLADMRFALEVAAAWPRSRRCRASSTPTPDLVDAVLEEAGEVRRRRRWRRSIASATSRAAGSRTAWCARPDGFKEAYRAYVEGGWNALAVRRPSIGGQGLPCALDDRGAGDVERGQYGLRAVPDADGRRGRGARARTARPSRSASICPSWSPANGPAR